MPQIISTLSAPVDYAIYQKKTDPKGPNTVVRKIRVNGGANVANKLHILSDGTLTRRGVVTSVTEEELELLKKDEVFQTHVKNNFIQVVQTDRKVDGDKAAADMKAKDASAPFTPQDYEKEGRAQKMAVPGADELKAPKVVENKDAPPAAATKGKK